MKQGHEHLYWLQGYNLLPILHAYCLTKQLHKTLAIQALHIHVYPSMSFQQLSHKLFEWVTNTLKQLKL